MSDTELGETRPANVVSPALAWSMSVIVVLAGVLRLWQVGDPLWLDELHTSWTVSGSWDELVLRARLGNQSVAYFVVVRAAVALLGTHEWTLRLPSLLAGIALVPCSALFVAYWTRSTVAAVLTGLLVAVDRQMIFYSQEARVYAIVQLLALFHVWLLLLNLRGPSARSRILFVLIGAGLFYLHYTTALLFAGEVVGAALVLTAKLGAIDAGRPAGERTRLGRAIRYTWRNLATDFGLLTALTLGPTIPHLGEVLSRRGQWWRFVDAIPDANMLASFWTYVPSVVVLVAAAFVPPRVRRPAGAAPIDASVVAVVVAWLLVPVSIAWLLTLTGAAPLFLYRYLAGSSSAPIVSAGLAVGYVRRPVVRIALVLAPIVLTVHWSGMPEQLRRDGRLMADRDEDWRGAVEFLNESVEGGQPVLVRSGLIEADRWSRTDDPELRRFCLFPVLGLYRLRKPDESLLLPLSNSSDTPLTRSDIETILARRGAWFLLRVSPRRCAVLKRRIVQQLENPPGLAGMIVSVDVHREFGDLCVLRVSVRRR